MREGLEGELEDGVSVPVGQDTTACSCATTTSTAQYTGRLIFGFCRQKCMHPALSNPSDPISLAPTSDVSFTGDLSSELILNRLFQAVPCAGEPLPNSKRTINFSEEKCPGLTSVHCVREMKAWAPQRLLPGACYLTHHFPRGRFQKSIIASTVDSLPEPRVSSMTARALFVEVSLIARTGAAAPLFPSRFARILRAAGTPLA